ncbi:MAG: hypothetical protein WC443_11335 [Desulfobaccales bacterium]
MIRRHRWVGLIIVLLLAQGGFPAWSAGVADESAIQGNSAYNDYALYIAGLSNPEGSLTANEQKPAWVNYAKAIQRSWQSFDQRLERMREWRSRELNGAAAATVFYPFSGPDFVNISTLFPQAKTYLMIALEPVGELPDFSAKNGMNFFGRLQNSLYELLNLDFFITAKMASSLKEQEIKGVLPVLLFFLAREQARVLDVRYWVMKPDGSTEEAPALARQRPGDGIPGVRIVFQSPGLTENQTLYYFRFNLRNDSYAKNQHFVSFLKSFGPMTTFAKAASYLMFNPGFSDIRGFILDQSVNVLQDDSAIPFKYFDAGLWDLKFYGTYTGPITLFKNRNQPDLAEVYKKGKEVYPLPFGIGYRHRLRTSNLIFAFKKVNLASEGAK